MESLKLALSMFDSKLDVCWAAEADDPAGTEDAEGTLFVEAEMVPPVFDICFQIILLIN